MLQRRVIQQQRDLHGLRCALGYQLVSALLVVCLFWVALLAFCGCSVLCCKFNQNNNEKAVANEFKNREIYFPHNLDFRGTSSGDESHGIQCIHHKTCTDCTIDALLTVVHIRSRLSHPSTSESDGLRLVSQSLVVL
jgi:hypothetical protein